MAMAEAYQGVLQADGRLMVNGSLVKSKAPRRVVFNFLDDTETADVAYADTDRLNKLAVIRKAISSAAEAENELTDADWDELTNIRARTNAGLSRRVEI